MDITISMKKITNKMDVVKAQSRHFTAFAWQKEQPSPPAPNAIEILNCTRRFVSHHYCQGPHNIRHYCASHRICSREPYSNRNKPATTPAEVPTPPPTADSAAAVLPVESGRKKASRLGSTQKPKFCSLHAQSGHVVDTKRYVVFSNHSFKTSFPRFFGIFSSPPVLFSPKKQG